MIIRVTLLSDLQEFKELIPINTDQGTGKETHLPTVDVNWYNSFFVEGGIHSATYALGSSSITSGYLPSFQ